MKLPLRIAKALIKMSEGITIPASVAKHSVIEDLIQENILFRTGKVKKTMGLISRKDLDIYLHNRFSIKELEAYITALEESNTSRAALTDITGDSKLRSVRTFKGFLANSFSPVPARLNSEEITFEPREGMFHFIYDFETFIPAEHVTIVGVENSENFRKLKEQAYLFKRITPLFVNRYPQNQSKDFIRWVKSIPNNYLHFGDFDMAGIGIYLNEYKKHIPEKSRFFIPDEFEHLLMTSGSRERYDLQKINFDVTEIKEKDLLSLIDLLHLHKKGLDQESLIMER